MVGSGDKHGNEVTNIGTGGKVWSIIGVSECIGKVGAESEPVIIYEREVS